MRVRVCFLFLFLGIMPAESQAQRVMTYNIRYDNPADGPNNWHNRKDWLLSQIRYYEAGIIGIQEALHDQVVYMDSVLNNFSYSGVGRDDGKAKGEYAPVFVDTTQFRVLDSGTFWLSPTPGIPSVGWDAAMERICTWVKLQGRANKQSFFVFNTHFDHRGEEARSESAMLIVRKISEINSKGIPVLLTGDLNTLPGSSPYSIFAEDLFDSKMVSLKSPYGPEGTYNGFDTGHPLDDRIDYIFVSAGIRVHSYAVLSEVRNGLSPSDHLPVLVDVSMAE